MSSCTIGLVGWLTDCEALFLACRLYENTRNSIPEIEIVVETIDVNSKTIFKPTGFLEIVCESTGFWEYG
jgi:hypothetical protein